MEARNRKLSDWFTRIRTRQLTLPRFQRFEAWTYRNVEGLLDTVLRELPAGAVLVLEIGDFEPFHSRPMVGAPADGERVSEQLLDGQQRLTALWRSLNDDYPDRSFLISLDGAGDAEEEDGPSGPRAVSWARWMRNEQRFPLWIDDPAKVWARRHVPVHLLRPDAEAETEFDEWAAAATGDDVQQLLALTKVGNELRSRFAQFNLPFLSLPTTTPPETALDVFVKMNTSAAPLSTYDIVVAQVEAGSEASLHELVEELRQEAPLLEHYANPADTILSAGAYLQDKPARRGVMLAEGFAPKLIADWDRIVDGARRASRFFDEEGVFDSARLPTDPVVPLLVALWSVAPSGLDPEGEARLMLRRFLWRSFLTDRYERASNTRALADYKAAKGMLGGTENESLTLFDDDLHPPPGVEDILLAGWPKKRERLARAVQLVSLKHGGLDLADGSPASRASLRQREYHHLFPVAYLRDQGVPERDTYRALNCALVTWKTNRNIGAKPPADYIRERADATTLGEDEVKRRLESHLIDYGLLVAGDYEAFLEARAETVASEALSLCE